jgi:hypothetical protein
MNATYPMKNRNERNRGEIVSIYCDDTAQYAANRTNTAKPLISTEILG